MVQTLFLQEMRGHRNKEGTTIMISRKIILTNDYTTLTDQIHHSRSRFKTYSVCRMALSWNHDQVDVGKWVIVVHQGHCRFDG